MKMFVESLIGKEIKKLKSWDNLSSAQVTTVLTTILPFCEVLKLGTGKNKTTKLPTDSCNCFVFVRSM